jgi:hypothetical protein
MTYFVSYLQSSNELIGISNVAPPALSGVYVAQYPNLPDLSCVTWDTSTLSFITVGLLSKLEFLTRFTYMERIGIRNSLDPVVADFMSLLGMAEVINLFDINTINGVGYLVYTGLLSPDRQAEILK